MDVILVLYETLKVLLGLVIASGVAWYLQYRWRYREFFKLAEKIEGPPELPLIGNIHQFAGKSSGEIMEFLKESYHKYNFNPFKLWLGTELFIYVLRPEHVQTLLTSNSGLLNAKVIREVGSRIMRNGLLTAPMDMWARHRRIISPTFNRRIINSYMPILMEETNTLLKSYEEEVAGKGVANGYPYVYKCILNTLLRTMMGKQSKENHVKIMKYLNTWLKILTARIYNSWLRFDLIFRFSSMYATEKECTEGVNNIASALIKQKREIFRKELEAKKKETIVEEYVEEDNQVLAGLKRIKAFLERLVELQNEDKMADDEIRGEVVSHILAGSDTTATSTTFTLMMMGMYPEVQKKVLQEVLDVVGPDREITPQDLNKLEYVERVAKEGLRLFPGVPAVARNPTKNMQIGEVTFPKDCSAVVSILYVHRNPDYWTNPLEFDPDRHLPEEAAKRHPFAYIPFSGGQRNCIGSIYGMMMMKVVIASVVRQFHITTPFKTVNDIKFTAEQLLKPVDGHFLALECR